MLKSVKKNPITAKQLSDSMIGALEEMKKSPET